MDLRRRLVSHSTAIFGARLFGAGLIFLTQAAIARVWGAEILGEYLLLIASINLIAVVMPLGFETIGTYFAAEYRARGEGRLLRGFIYRAYVHVLIVGCGLYVLGPMLLGWLGEAGQVLSLYWTPAIIMSVATAMVFVSSAVLVGLRRPLAGFFADGLFRPMLVIGAFGLIAATTVGQDGFSELIWLLALGFVAIAALQLVYMAVQVRPVPLGGGAPRAERGRWWRFAVPWVVIAFASDYFFDLDLLLLAGQLGRDELAIFGICTRVFALVSFGVAAVYAVTLPDVFESEANRDRAGFSRKIGDANLVAAGLSVVLFVAAAIGGPLLLSLFGPEFGAGAGPLAILCLSLVVRSVLGPAALVLSIHDRPYATLPAIALGLTTLVVANLVLVPVLGLVGASLAALLSISVWSGGMWLTAFLVAGVDVSIFARLRAPRVATPSGIGILPVD